MGDDNCLPGYRAASSAYLAAHAEELCDEHRESFVDNPLRVLDCKRPECVLARQGAPLLSDALCEPCESHFAARRCRSRRGWHHLAARRVLSAWL